MEERLEKSNFSGEHLFLNNITLEDSGNLTCRQDLDICKTNCEGNNENCRAANNETQLSFEASLKVVEEEEEEEMEEEYDHIEDYDTEYDTMENGDNFGMKERDFFAYDEEDWDWQSRVGDLAKEKDEHWDD